MFTRPLNWLASLVYKAGSTAYGMFPTWRNGQPTYPIANFYNNVNYGYRRNELIFACLALKSDSTSSADLDLLDANGEELEDHPILDLLNNPGPPQFSLPTFLSLIILHRDLAGASYWQKVRARNGMVVQLWPLRPDWMYPIYGAPGIRAYEYRIPGQAPATINTEDVLCFRNLDPIEIFSGLSPVAVAGRAVSVDNDSTDFIKSMLEQGGIPPAILTSKLKLNNEAVSDIRRRWKERYGGFRNWTEPAVLDSDASFQRTGMTVDELALPQMNERSESRICAVMRVPPILVGAQVGLERSTFSNYEEARKAFWEDTLMPVYNNILTELNRGLVPEFGGDIKLVWDFDEVPALTENANDRSQRAVAELQSGGITVNMFLKQVGEDEIGEPGDVFLRQSSVQMIPADATVDDLRAQAQEDALAARQAFEQSNNNNQQGDQGDNETDTKPAPSSKYMRRIGEKAVSPDLASPNPAASEPTQGAAAQAALKARQRKEAANLKVIQQVLTAQKTRAVNDLVVKNTSILESATEDTSLDWVNDPEWWTNEDDGLFASLVNRLLGTAQSAARYAVDILKEAAQLRIEIDPATHPAFNINLSTVDREVYDWAKSYTYEMVRGVNLTTRKELQKAISDWIKSDSNDINDLKRAIAPIFNENRASAIAITETTRAYTEGYVTAWKAAGNITMYEVYTAGDQDVDEECIAASVEGPYPLHDRIHRPPLHIGCRCGIQPIESQDT